MGRIQSIIIEIGRRRGHVVPEDIARFYPANRIKKEMDKLIAYGFFKSSDGSLPLKWKFLEQRGIDIQTRAVGICLWCKESISTNFKYAHIENEGIIHEKECYEKYMRNKGKINQIENEIA